MGGPPATGGEGASGEELAGASFLFGYFLWTSKENSHAAAGSGQTFCNHRGQVWPLWMK